LIGSLPEEALNVSSLLFHFYLMFDHRTRCWLPNACCDTIVLAEACQECAKQKIFDSVVYKQQLKSSDKKNFLSGSAKRQTL